MPLRHPEALPQYRTCSDCCRVLLLSSDNFALRKGPGRYPWQPSAYAPRCKLCQPAHLKALRAATKEARYAKEAERQRTFRKIVARSWGVTPAQIKAHRAAWRVKEAERLRRAALIAETRRILRNGRPYSPATDPIKRMIRARQGYYLAKRLNAPQDAMTPCEPEEPYEPCQDYVARLQAIRDLHLAAIEIEHQT